MTIRIWGARGSHPTPLRPEEVQSKIASVVQRIRPSDIESPDARERFLSRLPAWLFRPPGGNTACIEVSLSDGTTIVIDAGSGIVPYAAELQRRIDREIREFHLFFTHFHYDHLQGLPFFGPAYNPNCSIHFYSPMPDFEETVRNQMRHPYFPITMEERMRGVLLFHVLKSQPVRIGDADIYWRPLNHPGGAFGYRIEDNGKAFVHTSDVELQEADFEKTDENTRFFQDADMLILDTQYTLGEAIEKYNWGHSSFSLGVDFANAWNVKQLYMFHHEPRYSDKRLYKNLQSARWYAHRLGNHELEVYLSEEGTEVEL
jgi:phosphoribosyl 1,2-cyclic phosphodiesterase